MERKMFFLKKSGSKMTRALKYKSISSLAMPEGTVTTEQGKQPAAQEKRTRTTRQATQTQPLLLAADAFLAALEPCLLRTGAGLQGSLSAPCMLHGPSGA
jgi:hypothetical protein